MRGGAATAARDAVMMHRCIALSATTPRFGDLPMACVICEGNQVIAETTNQVRRDGDVTRHAEIMAVSSAQRTLKRRDLATCTPYCTVEPCPMCSFPIREARIGRVVHALNSPMMGGLSKWNVLRDRTISEAIPQVFGPVPEVVAGFMWQEAAKVWGRWNPIIWAFIKHRGYFGPPPAASAGELLPALPPARGRLHALLSLAVWR
jgi:tRNA(adenine34) deaminase